MYKTGESIHRTYFSNNLHSTQTVIVVYLLNKAIQHMYLIIKTVYRVIV